jgi:DNA-binding HxlR family transcriptional regulator
MASYHQFCPVAKAMELLDERWTMLVVRELVSGSEHFNDLRRGLPRMSPTLLSKRLHQLVRAGVVERRANGGEVRYVLTPAGQELRPIVEALGSWGIRWIGELGDRDLDPKLLLWDMRRNIDHEAVPAGRSVVEFEFLRRARAAAPVVAGAHPAGGRRVRRGSGLSRVGHGTHHAAPDDRRLARQPHLGTGAAFGRVRRKRARGVAPGGTALVRPVGVRAGAEATRPPRLTFARNRLAIWSNAGHGSSVSRGPRKHRGDQQ